MLSMDTSCACGCGATIKPGFKWAWGHNARVHRPPHGVKPANNFTAATWIEKLGVWFVPIPETGCWIWVRGLDTLGYGIANHLRRQGRAHRLSYELLRGPIPEGLEIDHLCRVRSCVNPDHLEAVDHRTNTLRGTSFSAINARKTHCKRGHEFTPENTYITPRGGRECITCRDARCAEFYRAHKKRGF